MLPAFAVLGERDPTLLRREYDDLRAGNTDAAFRAQIVTGVGLLGGTEGVELAREAFARDNNGEVRMRAVFVLTARAGAKLAEDTLLAALADVDFANDPTRLAQIGLALENLARLRGPERQRSWPVGSSGRSRSASSGSPATFLPNRKRQGLTARSVPWPSAPRTSSR